MTVAKWIAAVGMVSTLVAAGVYANARMGLEELDDAARARAPGAFVQLSDGKVHYAWHGPKGGPVVVLVHGFSTPSFVWAGLLEPLTRAGMRVLSYDHFGRGFSDRPHGAYDAERFDRQLLELLASQDVTHPVDLVGYSMGGAIVTHFVAQHPERVRRLALLAPAGFPVNVGWRAEIMRVPVLGDWLMAVIGKQTLLGVMALPENQGRAIPDIAARYEGQMRYEGYLRALLATMRDFPMGSMDAVFERVGELDMPVLSIWGRRDTTIPIENAQRLKRAVPQAEVEIIEQGTHAITYSEPERVSASLVAFFQRPEAGAP